MKIVHEPLVVDLASGYAPDDVFAFVHFVFTIGIVSAPVTIEAEAGDTALPTVAWRMRARPDGIAKVIGEIGHEHFRSALAYINAQFLDGQLYGGCIRRRLRQADREVIAAIHTSNEGATGFWIRIDLAVTTLTAFATTPPSPKVDDPPRG